MKKVIIFVIVLINLSAIYFWNFPYISKTDLMTYGLTDKALKRQTEIIDINGNINTIKKLVRVDSIFNNYLESAIEIHEINRESYSELQQIRDLMITELGEDLSFKLVTGDTIFYNLNNRLQPFHYQIPKRILFKKEELLKVTRFLDEQQSLILNQIENDSFRQIVRDSMLIKTADLENRFSGVHLQKALTLISGLQNQLKVLDYQVSAFLLSEVRQKKNEIDYLYQSFMVMIDTETPIVKRGDYFKAEIFAVTYSRNPSIRISVNGSEIPVKNGIGTYIVETASTGIKKFTVRISITNPLTRKTEDYRREFIYKVISKQD